MAKLPGYLGTTGNSRRRRRRDNAALREHTTQRRGRSRRPSATRGTPTQRRGSSRKQQQDAAAMKIQSLIRPALAIERGEKMAEIDSKLTKKDFGKGMMSDSERSRLRDKKKLDNRLALEKTGAELLELDKLSDDEETPNSVATLRRQTPPDNFLPYFDKDESLISVHTINGKRGEPPLNRETYPKFFETTDELEARTINQTKPANKRITFSTAVNTVVAANKLKKMRQRKIEELQNINTAAKPFLLPATSRIKGDQGRNTESWRQSLRSSSQAATTAMASGTKKKKRRISRKRKRSRKRRTKRRR